MDVDISYNLFNKLEALFWMVLGIILFVRLLYVPKAFKENTVYAGIVFCIFGVSDILEILIGGIFEPDQYWLLAIKAVCLIALVGLFINYFIIRKNFVAESDECPF